jgi:hypothetical protein
MPEPDPREDAKFWREMAERIRREKMPTSQFLAEIVDVTERTGTDPKTVALFRSAIRPDQEPEFAAKVCDTVADALDRLASGDF